MIDLVVDALTEFLDYAQQATDIARNFSGTTDSESTEGKAEEQNTSDAGTTKYYFECGKAGASGLLGLSGMMEYYCATHNQEILKIMSMMEESTATSNNPKHACELDACNNEGTNSIKGISGYTEYYCDKHYNEMLGNIETIFSSYCGAEGCNNRGTKKWVNFSGIPEYYCETHYAELMEALEFFGY